MASAPAIAPAMKTRVIAATQVSLELCRPDARVVAIIALLLMTGEGKKHLVAIHQRCRVRGRRIALDGENHFRGRAAGVLGLSRHQNGPQSSQNQQACQSQTSSEHWLEHSRPERAGLLFFDSSGDAGVKTWRRLRRIRR